MQPSGTTPLYALAYMLRNVPIWRRLLRHCVRLALSRALFRLGRRIEISTAMMPITTRSSTSVNAHLGREARIEKAGGTSMGDSCERADDVRGRACQVRRASRFDLYTIQPFFGKTANYSKISAGF